MLVLELINGRLEHSGNALTQRHLPLVILHVVAFVDVDYNVVIVDGRVS